MSIAQAVAFVFSGAASADVTTGGEVAVTGLISLGFAACAWGLYRLGLLQIPRFYDSRPMRRIWMAVVLVMAVGGAAAVVAGLLLAGLGIDFRTTA